MVESAVRRRSHDPLVHLREICEAFDSVPSVRKAVIAARKRARELQAERRGAAKKPRRQKR